jgi:hypothetical protein
VLNLTSAALKVFLALDDCDMRKSFNGLHTLASDQLQSAPARDGLFVFSTRTRAALECGKQSNLGLRSQAQREFFFPLPHGVGVGRKSNGGVIPGLQPRSLAWPQLPRVDHWWHSVAGFGWPRCDPVREIVFILSSGSCPCVRSNPRILTP